MAEEQTTEPAKTPENVEKPKRRTKRAPTQAKEQTPVRETTDATPTQQETPVTTKRSPKRDNIAIESQLLFGKYDVKGVAIRDQSLTNYINLSVSKFPHNFGRRKNQNFYLTHVNVVERLANKLMRGGTGKKVGGKVIRTEGRLQGKKLKVIRAVEESFEIINKQTNKNPIQVLVDALQNAAPIEDTTRVRYGGISYNVAVGISSQRRVDVALRNIALATLIGGFKNKRTLAEALANELILASNNSPDSYAIKKRVETERIARSAR